jgi:hypothetical protein
MSSSLPPLCVRFVAGRSDGRYIRNARFAKRLTPVLQSLSMQRWFFGFFFYFPCLLADGTG